MSKTNVIYDKQTYRVVAVEQSDVWILPNGLDIAHYEGDVTPIFTDVGGNVYLNPVAVAVEL